MRSYVQDTAEKWKDFQSSNGEIAVKIRDLTLAICSDMTSERSGDQIEAMTLSPHFGAFRDLALRHGESIGIREMTDNELALWIRTICYHETSGGSH